MLEMVTHNKTGTCPYDNHTDYTCKCTYDSNDIGGRCNHHEHICNKCHKWVITYFNDGDIDCDYEFHTRHVGADDSHVFKNTDIVYTCGYPTNTWTIQCGKSNGQIMNYSNGSVGSCYNALATDSATINHSGNASASIKLKEHRYLYYTGSNVRNDLVYSGSNVNLLLRDNIVIYYKRR